MKNILFLLLSIFVVACNQNTSFELDNNKSLRSEPYGISIYSHSQVPAVTSVLEDGLFSFSRSILSNELFLKVGKDILENTVYANKQNQVSAIYLFSSKNYTDGVLSVTKESKPSITIFYETSKGPYMVVLDYNYSTNTYQMKRNRAYRTRGPNVQNLKFLRHNYYNLPKEVHVVLLQREDVNLEIYQSSKDHFADFVVSSHILNDECIDHQCFKSKPDQYNCDFFTSHCDYGTISTETCSKRRVIYDQLHEVKRDVNTVLDALCPAELYLIRDQLIKKMVHGSKYIDLYYNMANAEISTDLLRRSASILFEHYPRLTKIRYNKDFNAVPLTPSLRNELVAILLEYKQSYSNPILKSNIDLMIKDIDTATGLSVQEILNSSIFK